ncbi:MAG: flagellar basal body rod protein FlgB [Plesiomonas sp.]|uniref:flagellar basal body rod protein FlgB n=1 Tax=Plesiomonas sp. TaxID=2486279 RepID=UPI003F360287
MSLSFDKALGVFPYTLDFRTERAKVLAGNLANVDTPNYKARDLSFNDVMRQIKYSTTAGPQTNLMSSDPNYVAMYRNPYQPSKDGNTVDQGVEQAQFARNAMDFQTSLTFMNMTFSGLKQAITGQ